MLLARWGELCCVGAVPRAVPWLMGFCSFRGQVGALRGDWEWYGLGC